MTTEVNDEAIAAAAESIDKASVSTATTNSTSEEPKTVKGMLAAMNKHSDGTNVMKESIKVCNIIELLLHPYRNQSRHSFITRNYCHSVDILQPFWV
jgi:hypothetical protein